MCFLAIFSEQQRLGWNVIGAEDTWLSGGRLDAYTYSLDVELVTVLIRRSLPFLARCFSLCIATALRGRWEIGGSILIVFIFVLFFFLVRLLIFSLLASELPLDFSHINPD
jgi:hypothetical protein